MDSEEWEESESLTDSLNQLVTHTVKDLKIVNSVMEQEVGLDKLQECFSLGWFCLFVCFLFIFKN